MSKTDCVAKYNQLIRSEEKSGDSSVYKGKEIFYNLLQDE
tara:strand:- start:3858 stop:3977 length:120 start_codon:yes stop_codon:yes gene_type:complete